MCGPVIDAIIDFNRGRDPALLRLKFSRMAASAFSFFRGTDHLFAAAWHELRPRDPGPDILCCGDLHLENFGAFVTDDGQARYDINDFDEALVAPCTLDVVRSTTSIFLAAEEWSLPPVQAATLALAFLSNYRRAVTDAAHTGHAGEITLGGRTETVLDLLSGYLGSRAKLLEVYTDERKGGRRRIARDKKHFKAPKKVVNGVAEAVEKYGAANEQPDEYRVLDVMGRIAGIGSLGLERYTVLIAGQGSPDSNRLLDIKEANPSAARAASEAPQPDFGGSEARRVVEAQRQLQGKPSRGLDVLRIGEEDYRLRDMIADENRTKLDAFRHDPDRLGRAIELAGRITGWSHIRGSHRPDHSATHELARWAAGPAMDAVLGSAIRFADRTVAQYAAFMKCGLKKLSRAVEKQGSAGKADTV